MDGGMKPVIHSELLKTGVSPWVHLQYSGNSTKLNRPARSASYSTFLLHIDISGKTSSHELLSSIFEISVAKSHL